MGLFRLLLRLIAGIGGLLAISEYLRGRPRSTVPPGKKPFKCGKGSGQSDTREIGPGGGQIGVAGHLLVIPPGALGSTIEFQMRELNTPHIQVQITPPVKFAPGTSATLTLSWARCPAGVEPNQPSIYNVDDNEDLGGRPNPQQRSVSTEITHLSRYAIAQI